MTSFRRYFLSHLKANARTYLTITIGILAMTFLIGMNLQPIDVSRERYQSTLFGPVLFLCILAYFLPVWELSFFKNRAHLDFAYALPISRQAMGVAHYLSGLLMLLGGFSLSYLLNFLLLLHHGREHFHLSPLLWHYLLCLLLGFALYSFLTFVFNEANSKGDGIWFMILYTFVFVAVAYGIGTVRDRFMSHGYVSHEALAVSLPFGVIDALTTDFQKFVEMKRQALTFWATTEHVVGFIVWCAVGLASAIGFLLTFGKRRVEKTEEISSSYFGFRTLIPIYAIVMMNNVSYGVSYLSDKIIIGAFIELFVFIGYAIYRRGVRYKAVDLIAPLAVFLLIFM